LKEFWCGPTDRPSAGGVRAVVREYLSFYRRKTEVGKTGISLCVDKYIILGGLFRTGRGKHEGGRDTNTLQITVNNLVGVQVVKAADDAK